MAKKKKGPAFVIPRDLLGLLGNLGLVCAEGTKAKTFRHAL